MGSEGELKRGEASLIKLLPPPFIREGDKGGGLPNKNLKGDGLLTLKEESPPKSRGALWVIINSKLGVGLGVSCF